MGYKVDLCDFPLEKEMYLYGNFYTPRITRKIDVLQEIEKL